MKLSGVLPLLFATSRNAAVSADDPASLRGGWGGDSEDSGPPALPEVERLPAGGTCCNCINVLDGFHCAERGDKCARCETFATGEGEREFGDGMQSVGVVDGNIYYPLEGTGPWPVISFGHGLGNRNIKTDRTRRNLLLFMVEMGFVVVAHRERQMWPAANYQAQLMVLDWLYESEFSHLADRSTTVMMGHSMGGRGTLTNVSNRETLARYNVKAAIAMHPWCVQHCEDQIGAGNCGIPLVPTLWVTGNEDRVANYAAVYTHYVGQVLSDKVYIERAGMGHHYPDNFLYDNDASMENTFREFVNCEVFDQEAACVSLFGEEDISDMLGDGEGVDLAIERDDDPNGFYQPWRGPGYVPEGTDWMDASDGYSRTKGYRLTTGPTTCTDSRDCKGANPSCWGECKNQVFCGKSVSGGESNCDMCRDEPDYSHVVGDAVVGDALSEDMFKEMRKEALEA